MGGSSPCELAHWGFRWSSRWGHETCSGRADIGGGDACERRHWGLRWSSLWGHETCEGCAGMGGGDACERRRWGFRWSSLSGHEAREGCAKMGPCTHARPATGAFGGAPYGALRARQDPSSALFRFVRKVAQLPEPATTTHPQEKTSTAPKGSAVWGKSKNHDGRFFAIPGLLGPFLGPRAVRERPRTKNLGLGKPSRPLGAHAVRKCDAGGEGTTTTTKCDAGGPHCRHRCSGAGFPRQTGESAQTP